MERQRLQEILRQLRRELADTEQLDREARAELHALADEIDRLAEGAGDGGPQGALGELEAAALRIESEHPRLSMLLGQVMDALGKLGI